MAIKVEVVLVEYLSHVGVILGQYPHTLSYIDDKPAALSTHAIIPTNLQRAKEILGAFEYNRVKARLQLNDNGDPKYFMFGETDYPVKDKDSRSISLEPPERKYRGRRVQNTARA